MIQTWPLEPLPPSETTVMAATLVGGEPVTISMDADTGLVIIRHPKWSLVGVGKDLAEAVADLRQECLDLWAVMHDDDPAELSAEAKRLRDWLLQAVEVAQGERP